MSMLHKPFWQDLGGKPVTGSKPVTLVMQSGRMTAQRHAEIQQIYTRFSLAKLTAVGDFFVFNRVLTDGTRVRLESMQGQDRVFVWAADAPVKDDEANAQYWRAIPSTSIRGGSGWVRHKTTGALRSVDVTTPITAPGYEGTDPHVLISAKNGSITLNSKHVAGEWYWTDHKKQQLLFAKDGAYFRQRLVNLHLDGTKVKGRVNGGGIAGGWILLVLDAKLYAVRKSAVLSAAGKPVVGRLVGDLPEWKITEGIRPVWRFSPDGLKAVAVEGLGSAEPEHWYEQQGQPVEIPKYLSSRSSGTTTGTQFIHRLQLTVAASVEHPFSLEVSREVRTNSALKIQPLYEFTPNKFGEDFKFLAWYASAYAEIGYVFYYDLLAGAPNPALTIFIPSPEMPNFEIELPENGPPWEFYIKYSATPGAQNHSYIEKYNVRPTIPYAIRGLGQFFYTYAMPVYSKPIGETLDWAQGVVDYYVPYTRPGHDLVMVAESSAAARSAAQSLGSPSTYAELENVEPIFMRALPSFVAVRIGDVPVLAPHMHEASTGDFPDVSWSRYHSPITIKITPIPAYNLHQTFDYTAATSWVFSGRFIVDMDYGPDGKERELALVGDETRAVRYSVAIRAVDVYAGALDNEADAQRRLSGACAYTLQLDGDVVAERLVTASDSYSGFLWTEQLQDWAGFRSGPWDGFWDNGEFYGQYLGLQRHHSQGTGQIANTECAGSMACRVSDQSFELLDFDVRFKHVLLAQTRQTLTRTTQATAIDAVLNNTTLNMALWDNGKLRTLGEQVEMTSRQWWTGSVPLLQKTLYAQSQLTQAAAYLSGGWPPMFRFGGIGSTPVGTTAKEYDDRVGALVVPLIKDYEGSAAHFSATMGVLPAYEALVRTGYASNRSVNSLPSIGGAETRGRVLSYGADVWLVVVNRDRLPLASFSVARTKNANAPSAAKRLHQLLPFLRTVAGTNGALALPGFVT